MVVCFQNDTNPAELLPPDKDWLTREQAYILLGIEESQLRQDQAVLLELTNCGLKGFDYRSGERGFTQSAFAVLWEFRKLVRRKGRKKAIAQIISKMEEYFNECERQKNN